MVKGFRGGDNGGGCGSGRVVKDFRGRDSGGCCASCGVLVGVIGVVTVEVVVEVVWWWCYRVLYGWRPWRGLCNC